MFPIQAVHTDPDMHIQVNDDYLPLYIDYDNPDHLDQGDLELTLYTQFYNLAVHLAGSTERRDRCCHNCKEPGHFWHDCQKPLKEEFKCLMDHSCQQQEELNKNRGPRVKGGQVPQVAPAQPQPVVLVQMPAAAQQ